MENRFLLIIPEYNDSERLSPFLKELSQEMDELTDIQIISDGSSPEQHSSIVNLVKKLKEKNCRANILDPKIYHPNRGKGAAIRTGFKARNSSHYLLGFVDADGAICPEEIKKLKREFDKTPSLDALFASRRLKGSVVERSHFRKFGSYIISKVLKKITDLKIEDTQCGLKLIKSETYSLIENNLCSEGFELDIEIALLLNYIKAKTLESPIEWKEKEGSKVKVIKDTIALLKNSARLKKRLKNLS
jgi:dolichyl-phosphate beta-glucosyltransferase